MDMGVDVDKGVNVDMDMDKDMDKDMDMVMDMFMDMDMEMDTDSDMIFCLGLNWNKPKLGSVSVLFQSFSWNFHVMDMGIDMDMAIFPFVSVCF